MLEIFRSFFYEEISLIRVFMFLAFMDILTGLMKERRLGKPLRSGYLSRGVLYKLVLLVCVVIWCFVCIELQKTGVKFLAPASVQEIEIAVLCILLFGEFFSVLNNVHTFKSGKERPDLDIVGSFLEKTYILVTSFFEKKE